MNVRLRVYEYCYTNLGAIYTKDLYSYVARLSRVYIKFQFLFCFHMQILYLLTAGLREKAFNVTQSWPGILKVSPSKAHKQSSTPQNLKTQTFNQLTAGKHRHS